MVLIILNLQLQRYLKIKPTAPIIESGTLEADLLTSPSTAAAQSTGAIPKVRTSIIQQQSPAVEQEVRQIETEVKSLILDDGGSVDADIVTLPCSLCREEVVCTVKDMRAMTNHLEQVHKQRVCPVCSQLFDESMEGIDEYFHLHVENHFDVPHIYPSLGSGFEALGGAN